MSVYSRLNGQTSRCTCPGTVRPELNAPDTVEVRAPIVAHVSGGHEVQHLVNRVNQGAIPPPIPASESTSGNRVLPESVTAGLST